MGREVGAGSDDSFHGDPQNLGNRGLQDRTYATASASKQANMSSTITDWQTADGRGLAQHTRRRVARTPELHTGSLRRNRFAEIKAIIEIFWKSLVRTV